MSHANKLGDEVIGWLPVLIGRPNGQGSREEIQYQLPITIRLLKQLAAADVLVEQSGKAQVSLDGSGELGRLPDQDGFRVLSVSLSFGSEHLTALTVQIQGDDGQTSTWGHIDGLAAFDVTLHTTGLAEDCDIEGVVLDCWSSRSAIYQLVSDACWRDNWTLLRRIATHDGNRYLALVRNCSADEKLIWGAAHRERLAAMCREIELGNVLAVSDKTHLKDRVRL